MRDATALERITEVAVAAAHRLWVGRILTGIVRVFLTCDVLGKLLEVQPVIDGTVQLGYIESVLLPVNVAALVWGAFKLLNSRLTLRQQWR